MNPQRTHKNSNWSLLVGLVAVILLIIASVVALRTAGIPAVASLTATVPPSQGVTNQGTPISTYPTDYPPFKQTAEVGSEQTRQALVLTITPFTPSSERPPTYTPEPFVPGIYDSQAAPVPPAAFSMTNWWQDIVNGERTRVFAGARQDKTGSTYGSAQGVVLVSVSGSDLTSWDSTVYGAPENASILQITSVAGFRLTLQDNKGNQFYFDVPTRQFVDSQDVTSIAPTVTTLPSSTPGAPPVTVVIPTGYPVATETAVP